LEEENTSLRQNNKQKEDEKIKKYPPFRGFPSSGFPPYR